MNKLKTKLLILAVALFAFVACDKEEGNDSVVLLVKETIENEKYGHETIEYQYNEQNQLKKMKVHSVSEYYIDDVELDLSYEQDLLKELLVSMEGMQQKMQFTYAGDTITTTLSVLEGDDEWYMEDFKNVFLLNSLGEVIRSEEYVLLSDQWKLHANNQYQWVNGNFVENISVYNVSSSKKSVHADRFYTPRLKKLSLLKSMSNETTQTAELSYNAMNNPYESLGLLYAVEAINENVASAITIKASTGEEYTIIYTYEHNDKNYPTKVIETDNEGNTMTTIYEYESK